MGTDNFVKAAIKAVQEDPETIARVRERAHDLGLTLALEGRDAAIQKAIGWGLPELVATEAIDAALEAMGYGRE